MTICFFTSVTYNLKKENKASSNDSLDIVSMSYFYYPLCFVPLFIVLPIFQNEAMIMYELIGNVELRLQSLTFSDLINLYDKFLFLLI